MGRRAAGEGSIYRLKTGGYAAMLTIGYVDGKRKRKKFQGATRKEVADKLAVAARQVAAGVNLTSKTQTVRVFLKQWLEDTVTPTARPKTIATYAQVVRDYINPILGDVILQKLTTQQAQAMLTDLYRRSFAPRTIRLVRAILYSALQQAVDWRILEHNPVARTVVPRIEQHDVQVLTIEQARAFLNAARSERLECALRLALSLGLRRGEVCGLRWEDIEGDVLHVRGNVQYVQGNGTIYGLPKTKSSQRTIKLPATLVAALHWHKERQRGERASMGKSWQDSGYVFVSVRTGGVLSPQALVNTFKRVLERAELPVLRFHALRHSCASFLIAQNVHVKIISAILGHSSIQITMNLYGHLLPGAMDEAAERVDDLLKKDEKTSAGNTSGNSEAV